MQPDPATVLVRERLDEARRAAPLAKLVEFHCLRSGLRFTMAVPPSSPWYQLLPEEQHAEIRAEVPPAP